MSEALERAIARQSLRLDPSVTDPPAIRSLDDIKRLLAEFDPATNKVTGPVVIHAQLPGRDQNNKPKQFSVSAPTRSKSRREILLEGMQLVKNRMEARESATGEPIEVNGQQMRPVGVAHATDGRLWVDPLLHRWLGAQRRGLTIYWRLADGYEYRYDIFQHTLSRVI